MKMARTALGWSTHELAKRAEVGRVTVARFESGEAISDDSSAKIESALTDAGIRFIGSGIYAGGVCPPSN
tara:strand:- start:277 stop:486 length:210 start_codon:yes stop_codon:yes gene_type:complete